MAELDLRDLSPVSDAYTLESDFSLFSSASVDRCSFASDAHDRDSLSSDFFQHLAGLENRGRECLRGQGLNLPDLSKVAILHSADGYLGKKAKGTDCKHKDRNVLLEVDDEPARTNSARNSFSLALKECQERRSRSEALARNSLDLDISDSVVVSSFPRLSGMKNNTGSSGKSCNFPSPGTPHYGHASGEVSKGWSSERASSQASANRRHVGTALLQFNNGRTLPSKWEDAERWIFSPVAGDGIARSSHQRSQRRPKSKSGPLGSAGVAYYSMYSPGIPVDGDGNVADLNGASRFSNGVMMHEDVCVGDGGSNGNGESKCEPCIARSASVHACSDLVCQSPSTSSPGEKVEDAKDDGVNEYPALYKRDMATQMSHQVSSHSSSRRKSSSSSMSAPSILRAPVMEAQSSALTRPEVRDVQVDERVIVTRWSKKHKSRISGRGSEETDNWKLKAVEAHSLALEASEAQKNLDKAQRDEARINAWENLQKAKAEAAIRELEIKLEKKRSASMAKIMNKLRLAQNKAQAMRSSVVASQDSKNCSKAIAFLRARQTTSSLSGCFTCRAF